MKLAITVTGIALALASCGNTSAKSAVKSDEVSGTRDYSCSAISTLDGSVMSRLDGAQQSPSAVAWYENFDFKSTDTSIYKGVGVTNGSNYTYMVKRGDNHGGKRINLYIIDMSTKASAIAQVEEGTKEQFLVSMSPDGKFRVTLSCKIK